MEKIDALTLRAWGEDQSETPLKIAVSDSDKNTPFSLAFYRGHYDVAWRIAEIAHAQYSPPDEEKKLYRLDMRGENDDETASLDSNDEPYSDSEEPRIVSRTVDDKFTIDNIGEISMQVKSQTRAIDFIQFSCNGFEVKDGVPDPETCRMSSVLDFFIERKGQMGAFKRFLNMCIHFGGKGYGAAPEADSTSFTLDEGTFRYIVEKGRVDMLKEVIRHTGAGIPLDHLVKRSGVEMKEKPRYYPGLSVYGKKRYVGITASPDPPISFNSIQSCQYLIFPDCMMTQSAFLTRIPTLVERIGQLQGAGCMSILWASGLHPFCTPLQMPNTKWFSGS